jgi:hypothetical protein
MMRSGFNPNPVSHVRDPYKGCPAMKSKLFQRISYSLDRSDDVLDDQQENIEDSSESLEAARDRTTRSTWLLTPRPEPKLADQIRKDPG